VTTTTRTTSKPSRAAPHSSREVVQEAVRRRDVRALARAFFGVTLTRGQAQIVRAVAFGEHRRVIINAHTRYGKTWSVALGICLRILLDRAPLKIRLIGPTRDQAGLLRDYIADFIQACPPLQALLDLQATGAQRLRKEVSKKRYTFRDGKDLRVLTAEGKASRIMGFGGDIVVVDESCLLHPDAWAKISRMLGDSPTSVLIEMSNPWDRENHYYRHWESPRFHRIHVGWEQGVREGRVTRDFVDEQRGELSPMEFTILMESDFPETSRDQLIGRAWVQRAIAGEPFHVGNMHGARVRYGLDVAEGGTDSNVLTQLRMATRDGCAFIEVEHVEGWPEADTAATADRAADLMAPGSTVVVDTIGVGKGVADQLRRRGFKVHEFKASNRADEDKRFQNLGAEGYWWLRKAFEEDRIRLPREARKLTQELGRPKWTTKPGRIAVDKTGGGGKSPDYADSLMMAVRGTPARRLIVGG
jgi:hypothetical protein